MKYPAERQYRERKEETISAKTIHHMEAKRYDEKKPKESRDVRYAPREQDKYRRDRYDDKQKDKASKTLQDLRERLINKRTLHGDEVGYDHPEASNSRGKYREHPEMVELALRGSAGAYVKEIIDISTGDEKRTTSRKSDRMREEDRLTEEERAEQELRREKLLEAGILYYILRLY